MVESLEKYVEKLKEVRTAAENSGNGNSEEENSGEENSGEENTDGAGLDTGV